MLCGVDFAKHSALFFLNFGQNKMNSWLGESCPKSKKILEHPFGLARDLKFRFALALSPRIYGQTMEEGRTLFFSQMFSRFQAYKKETSNFLLYLTRGSNLALTFNSITLLRIPRNKSNFPPAASAKGGGREEKSLPSKHSPKLLFRKHWYVQWTAGCPVSRYLCWNPYRAPWLTGWGGTSELKSTFHLLLPFRPRGERTSVWFSTGKKASEFPNFGEGREKLNGRNLLPLSSFAALLYEARACVPHLFSVIYTVCVAK